MEAEVRVTTSILRIIPALNEGFVLVLIMNTRPNVIELVVVLDNLSCKTPLYSWLAYPLFCMLKHSAKILNAGLCCTICMAISLSISLSLCMCVCAHTHIPILHDHWKDGIVNFTWTRVNFSALCESWLIFTCHLCMMIMFFFRLLFN